MGRATELLQLPTRMLVEGNARRRRLIFAAVGALAVTAAAAAGAAVFVLDSGKGVTLHHEWASFQGCMLGEPLEPQESPSARYRLLALGQLQAQKPGEKAPEPAKAWPSTCLASLGPVVDTAMKAPAGGEELAKAATAVGKAVNTGTLAATPKLLDDLWKAAANAKLTDAPAPRHASTPKAVTPAFPRAAFDAQPKPFGNLSLLSVRAEVSPGATTRFLLDDATAKGPTFCQAEPGSPSALACSVLPPDVAKASPGLRLLGASDPGAVPLVFTGERGAGAVFRELATPIAVPQGATFAGGAAKSGKRARVLARKPTGVFLVEVAPKDGKETVTETRLREPSDTAILVSDWVFARDKDTLTVQKAAAGEKIVELGPMPEAISKKAEDRAATCRVTGTEVVRLRGAENDFVTLSSGGEWSAPQKVRATDQLSCAEGVATLVTTTHTEVANRVHATVRFSRCTAAGCKESTLSHYDMVSGNAEQLPATRSELAVAAAGTRLFFAWFTAAGDLRVRSGTAETIATAADTLVTVGGDEASSVVREVALVPSTSGAILLTRNGDGVRAFSFGVDGTLTPATVKL